MNDLRDALGGAFAIIVGGYALLMFASSSSLQTPVNLMLWGSVYMVGGVFLAVTAIAAAIGA